MVTRTWANCDAPGEFHTRRAWGSRDRKKQIDYVMGPRDLQFKTWGLNRARLRNWDHYLELGVKGDGKELRVREGK